MQTRLPKPADLSCNQKAKGVYALGFCFSVCRMKRRESVCNACPAVRPFELLDLAGAGFLAGFRFAHVHRNIKRIDAVALFLQ